MSITTHRSDRRFGTTSGGDPVELVELRNGRGTTVEVISLGATLRAVRLPGRLGAPVDVVACLPSVEAYERSRAFPGATVGRYAGRIGGGAFTLDGVRHVLDRNDGEHTLHGGARGLHHVPWVVDPPGVDAPSVTLRHASPAGDQGFPGTLLVTARYVLTEADEVHVVHRATTDAPTVVALACHACFNLAGEGASVLGHELTVVADTFAPVDADGVATGELLPVERTPFDLRAGVVLGRCVDAPDAQVASRGGLDHGLVLAAADHEAPRAAARLVHPPSGWAMELLTTAPVLHVSTGNDLAGDDIGCEGRPLGPHSSVCLDAQRFPDAPNRPAFPSAVLRPGQTYEARTVYRFLTEGP